MEKPDIEALLSDFRTTLDEDQFSELRDIASDIESRYPIGDGEDRVSRAAALTVAYRLMAEPNDTVIDDLADKLEKARIAQDEAMAGLRQAAVTVLPSDSAERGYGHYSENEFAIMAGVDRMTVRKWLGKR